MTKPHNLILAALLLTVTTAHGEEIKLRNSGDACTSSNEGAIYYDDGDDTFYFCRNASTGWEAFEDLAPASSGGGVPTYVGATTTTYDGNQGGEKAMDALCNAEFSGSRMMRTSDTKYLLNSITAGGWVYCDNLTTSASRTYCATTGQQLSTEDNAYYANCSNFNTNNSSTVYRGLVYSSSSILPTSCAILNSILCVKD